MEMNNALIGIIGVILAAMLTLILSSVSDLKKEVHNIWEALNLKRSQEDCNRNMDKYEEKIKEIRNDIKKMGE